MSGKVGLKTCFPCPPKKDLFPVPTSAWSTLSVLRHTFLSTNVQGVPMDQALFWALGMQVYRKIPALKRFYLVEEPDNKLSKPVVYWMVTDAMERKVGEGWSTDRDRERPYSGGDI